MSDDAFEFKDLGLDRLISALAPNRVPHTEIGVLGKKSIRDKNKEAIKGGLKLNVNEHKVSSAVDTSTNAGVGAIHEYGLMGMPVRSFLRMPINEHLDEYLEKSGLFKEETFKKVIETKDATPWFEIFGIVATQVVEEAFNTGGFGKWKSSIMELKKVKQTLVETQQLRRSINYRVVK